MTDLLFSPDGILILAVVLIALALAAIPALEQRHQRRGETPAARRAMYRDTMILLWGLAIIAVAGWALSGRPMAEIGFAPVREGWFGLAAWAITAVVVSYCLWQIFQAWVSRTARVSIRKQIGDIELTDIRPRTANEAWHFQALSVTAGITEEIIFRGVLIAAFALVMPLWAAVILSLIAFTLPHAYQGPAGMIRVASHRRGADGHRAAGRFAMAGHLGPRAHRYDRWDHLRDLGPLSNPGLRAGRGRSG
jgi:membrane protease YdiL (CAAX protease family)